MPRIDRRGCAPITAVLNQLLLRAGLSPVQLLTIRPGIGDVAEAAPMLKHCCLPPAISDVTAVGKSSQPPLLTRPGRIRPGVVQPRIQHQNHVTRGYKYRSPGAVTTLFCMFTRHGNGYHRHIKPADNHHRRCSFQLTESGKAADG